MNSSALPAALAANWLSTAWEQHGGFFVSSPGSTTLEQIALRWTIELLGLPPAATGVFVTGSTVADVVSLVPRGQSLLGSCRMERRGRWPVRRAAHSPSYGAEAHPTLFKALGIVGLGRRRVVTVPVDAHGRMRADALPVMSGPTIVCVQAGNVNTGAFDPVSGDRRARAGVRGADVDSRRRRLRPLGAVAPRERISRTELELADSWATDAHKWLNSPYDCGMAIVRDGRIAAHGRWRSTPTTFH